MASTSRQGGPRAAHPNRVLGEITRATNAGTPQRTAGNSTERPKASVGAPGDPPNVIAIRAGEPMPDGYTLVVRGHEAANTPANPVHVVDMTTGPDCAFLAVDDDVDNEKRKSSDGRPSTRTTNKRVQTSFVKEVKASLAGGRPPALHVGENETHLKARWHSAAKEAAYKLLDMRKEGWKSYSIFDKTKVHREINRAFVFDPPLDLKRVDKYLAAHLRSSRAVWKAHWVSHGEENRHPNCPEEAWDKLTKWWPTEQCMEESAKMVGRRKLVQHTSKNGRTRLVDRMEDQVCVSVMSVVLRSVRHCATQNPEHLGVALNLRVCRKNAMWDVLQKSSVSPWPWFMHVGVDKSTNCFLCQYKCSRPCRWRMRVCQQPSLRDRIYPPMARGTLRRKGPWRTRKIPQAAIGTALCTT